MDKILDILLTSGLLAAIIGVAVKGFKLLGLYFDQKMIELNKKMKNAAIAGAVTKAQDHLWAFVNQAAQEMGDQMKAAAVDGKLTEEEKMQLREFVKNKFFQSMGDATLQLLHEYTSDLDAWVQAQIDSYARAAKAPQSSLP